MKWLKWLLAGVAALLLLFAAVGLALPSQFRVERSVAIAAPAEKVYPLIASPTAWKRWTVWNRRDPKMRIEYAGPASGIGARWSWRSETEGNGSMEFTEAVADRRLAYRLSFPDLGMQSTGLLLLTPNGDGVRLSWSSEGTLGASPVNRWFGLFMDRLLGPDFEAGLENLKQLAETS